MVFVHGSVVLGVDLPPHKFPATDLPNSPRNRGFLGQIFAQIAKNSRQRYYRSTWQAVLPGERYYHPKAEVLPPQRYYRPIDSGTTARRQKISSSFWVGISPLVLESSFWCAYQLPQRIPDDNNTARLKCTLTPPSAASRSSSSPTI